MKERTALRPASLFFSKKGIFLLIDAHNHADWLGKDVRRVLADMDKNGIDKAWILSWESPLDEYNPEGRALLNESAGADPVPFSRCLAYREYAPERFILGFAPDPRRPDAVDRLKAAVALHGVKVCGEVKLRMMYDNPDALRLFRYCGEAGLPVTLHLEYPLETGARYPRPDWWYGGGIDCLERVLRQCPGTVFLGHAMGFWSHICADGQHGKVEYPQGKVAREGELQRLLRRYPNLYGDLSGFSGYNALNRDPEYAARFVEEFSDRLLFARDAYDSKLFDLLESLPVDGSVKQKLYAGNAARLLGS